MTALQQPDVAETPAYWTHKVQGYPSPVAVTRMAQLIDYDPRVTDTARVVYRFLISWYHRDHGDALISQRRVAQIMRSRAPGGATCPSNSAVSRALINLMETGWVARTFKGRGKEKKASRYVPVFNVLELAEQGRFPEVAHPVVHLNDYGNWPTTRATSQKTEPLGGPVDSESGPPSGPKTHIPDTVTLEPCTGSSIDIPPVAGGLAATAPDAGFQRLAAAYAKPGDNLVKARRAFDDVAPDTDELNRMIRSAESWRKTAKGKRMSLRRWLQERRWLSGSEFVNDNRPIFQWPSCVVTAIKTRGTGDNFDGAKIWFRNRDGDQQLRVLDLGEYEQLQIACGPDRPAVSSPSDDLHEFVGARFQLDAYGNFDPIEREAAA